MKDIVLRFTQDYPHFPFVSQALLVIPGHDGYSQMFPKAFSRNHQIPIAERRRGRLEGNVWPNANVFGGQRRA